MIEEPPDDGRLLVLAKAAESMCGHSEDGLHTMTLQQVYYDRHWCFMCSACGGPHVHIYKRTGTLLKD